MFEKEKQVNLTSYWSCQMKRTKGCKARIILDNNAIKKWPKEHNHLPNEIAVEQRTVKNQLKRKIEEDLTIPTMQIYNRVSENL